MPHCAELPWIGYAAYFPSHAMAPCVSDCVCHRCAPARASPRTIPPIAQERSARLMSRPRPRRGLSPPQYSAPSLAAGAAGDEGAAHRPPRRARPLSRRVAAMASRRCCAIELATRAAPRQAAFACNAKLICLLVNCFLVAHARTRHASARQLSHLE